MVVGENRISFREIVGNTSGSPPACSTPRFTASTSAGMCAWQVL